MKKVLFSAALIIAGSKLFAQVVDDKAGKTYYYYDETTHKKLKEVYHHKDMIKIVPDKKNYGNYVDTLIYMKHGPYTQYDPSGNLLCTGYFIEDKKDSIWKYYNPKGSVIKTEKWRRGSQVQ